MNEGEDIRLVLSFGAGEPRDSGEDGDEDDADYQGPSEALVSYSGSVRDGLSYPFAIVSCREKWRFFLDCRLLL